MKAYKLIIGVFSLIICSFSIYSQETIVSTFPVDDITHLNKRILKLFAKSHCYKDYKELKIVHIFDMVYQGKLEKSDFESYNFLNKIKPKYMRKKSLFSKIGYLSTEAYIYERENKLVALSSDLVIYCLINCPNAYLEDRQKLYYLLDRETKFVFSIYGTPENMFFVLEKSGNVSVLVETGNHISLMNMNDFLNKYWDYFEKGITKYWED